MKPLAILFAAWLGVGSAAQAGPLAVLSMVDDEDASVVLVDTASRVGAAVNPSARFTSIFRDEAPDPVPNVAQSYRVEADCRLGRTRYHDLVVYDAGGRGQAVPVAPSAWRVQQAGAVGAAMLGYLCGRATSVFAPVDGAVPDLIRLLHR